MKSSIFQYPYDKVFRRTRGALSKLGMKIVSSDAIKGKITAQRNFSFFKPYLRVDLIVEQMEQQNTRVIVQNVIIKKQFFHKNKAADVSEAEILEAISSII